ncbi:hypothetical protein [Nonlabens sp.]|uniref:hypothetical protein n=1 Tax=Nonlabens sp. TaxID=1888209 RepID=UPI001BD03539|nr:hypothetical protein [Nonlabens sp.]
MTFCSWPYDDPEDGYHVAGATCTPAYMWTETVFIDAGCSSSGGEGSSGTGTGSGTASGTGGGAGDPTPTAPLPSDTCESSLGDTGITGSDECITSADDIERGNLIQSLGAQLSEAQINWINTTRNIALIYNLNDFIEAGNFSNQNAYQNQAAEIIDSAINRTLVTAFPFVKYPTGSNYATLYPKLTEYLKNQLPTLKNNTTIIKSIKTYTNLTTAQIQENLQWGRGTVIKVEQLGSAYGMFKKSVDPDSLYLDIDLVNLLETSTSGTDLADAMAFLIGVTILHEFVHYGDYNNNGDAWQYPQEEGLLFENDVYGQSVWIQNAEIILKNL